MKVFSVFATLLLALGMLAQTATQTTPAPDGNSATAASCCDHDKGCCSKDAKCCGSQESSQKGACCGKKSDKMCSMMSDKSGKMTCCSGGKCDMQSSNSGKSCCGGKMCARPQSGV